MSTSGPLDASAGQRSAFPDLETLDELDLECDPSGAQDAFEYLALVRKEARSLPLVMKSELVSTSEKNDHIGPVPNNDPDGQIVLPGDWYSGLAYKFSQSRAKYKTQDTNPVEFSVDMIDCEIDDDGDAVDSYYGDDGEDDEQSDDGEPVESLNEPAADEDSENLQMDLGHNPGSLFRLSRQHMRKYFIDNPPDIDLVCNLSLPQVLRLLFFFTKWISANADEWLYPWIFELLARLPTVLSGSEASIVRELGKKCARLYSRCATVAAKNTMRMVLAIVSQEFGQCDLATVQRQQKTVVPY